ncbi:MAG: hypothetical protein HKN32_07305 [Flavobacteriales bacterium]|nr:hypothetical protein [Flavobacteriales bacterium]
MKNCLLLGRKAFVMEDLKTKILAEDVHLFGGTSLQEVKEVFAKQAVDIVIIGAGLPIEVRLEIIRFVFENSNSTTVHMKDWDSGPAGMIPFVNGILLGIPERDEPQ